MGILKGGTIPPIRAAPLWPFDPLAGGGMPIKQPVRVYEGYSDYGSSDTLSVTTALQKVNVPSRGQNYVGVTIFNTHATQILYADLDRDTSAARGIPIYAQQSVTIPCRVIDFVSLIASAAATTGVIKFWRAD